MVKSVRNSVSTKVSVRDGTSNVLGRNVKRILPVVKKALQERREDAESRAYGRRPRKLFRTWSNSEESFGVEGVA